MIRPIEGFSHLLTKRGAHMDVHEVLHSLLVFWLASTSLLAILYLRNRLAPNWRFFLWGLVACFPGLGPVLVFLARPGSSTRQR